MRASFLFLNVAAIAGLSTLPRALAWGAAGMSTSVNCQLCHVVMPYPVKAMRSSRPSPSRTSTQRSSMPSVLSSRPMVTLGFAATHHATLASVATWADKERNHMRWSAPLHYVGSTGDHPPDNCLFPGTDGWQGKPLGNVLDAIHNVTSILSDFVSGSGANAVAPGQAQEALKFLIHFVGDMHQPLHLTGRDRGANGVKVVFGDATRVRNYTLHYLLSLTELRDGTDLHSLWDTYLIAKHCFVQSRATTPNRSPCPPSSRACAARSTTRTSAASIWEGVGVGQGTGRWESEIDSWFSMP
jgi:hypothetical protein